MKIKIFLLIASFAILNGCNQSNKVKSDVTNTAKSLKNATYYVPEKKDSLTSDKHDSVKLDNGFIIKTHYRFGTGKYRPLHSLEILHDGLTVFRDTTDTATGYRLRQKSYPILKQVKPNVFELLVAFNSGFNKDMVALFDIENNKVIKRKIMPAAAW